MKKNLTRVVPVLLGGAALSTFLSLPALADTSAENRCAPRDLIVTSLAMDYGETHVGSGFQGTQQILEVFASDDKGTWTIIVTETNGVACIISAGTDWHERSMLPVGVPG